MSRFLILLGGPLTAGDRLAGQIAGARVIAADSGIGHAKALGVTPELWVGDFDSANITDSRRYGRIERQSYPAAKALTDGEIAIDAALERGATHIILAGALGGERADHAWAHMVKAVALALRGIECLLTSGDEEAYPLVAGSSLELDLPKASLFSVLGLDTLEDLTITNARYPLAGFHLEFGSSRTISNVAEGPVHFSLGAGRGMVLARPHDFSGV